MNKEKLPYFNTTIEFAVSQVLNDLTVGAPFYLWGNCDGDKGDRITAIAMRIQEEAYSKGVFDTQQAMKTALGIK